MIIDITKRGVSPNAGAPETTDAIQSIIGTMASGDTLLIPNVAPFNIAASGIRPKDNTSIQLDGTLQQVTQPNEDYCRILMLEGTKNVSVAGNGILRGDRDTHVGDEGIHGARGSCVEIREGATNIILSGFWAINSWADGICFNPAPTEAVRSVGVTVNGIKCNNNRRNGLSVIDGDTIKIINCAFRRNGKGARATPPYLGIDLECDTDTQGCLNITIENNVFDDNGNTKHDGNVSIGSPHGAYRNIFVSNTNTFDWRYQPIIVTGNGGKLGASFLAYLAKDLFWSCDWYRYPGFPDQWRSA